jgi:hypothetical protein
VGEHSNAVERLDDAEATISTLTAADLARISSSLPAIAPGVDDVLRLRRADIKRKRGHISAQVRGLD